MTTRHALQVANSRALGYTVRRGNKAVTSLDQRKSYVLRTAFLSGVQPYLSLLGELSQGVLEVV